MERYIGRNSLLSIEKVTPSGFLYKRFIGGSVFYNGVSPVRGVDVFYETASVPQHRQRETFFTKPVIHLVHFEAVCRSVIDS